MLKNHGVGLGASRSSTVEMEMTGILADDRTDSLEASSLLTPACRISSGLVAIAWRKAEAPALGSDLASKTWRFTLWPFTPPEALTWSTHVCRPPVAVESVPARA